MDLRIPPSSRTVLWISVKKDDYEHSIILTTEDEGGPALAGESGDLTRDRGPLGSPPSYCDMDNRDKVNDSIN